MTRHGQVPGPVEMTDCSESTSRFPQSLEIASGFPHSTQDDGYSGWESGKPKIGFPLSHRTILSLYKRKDTLGFSLALNLYRSAISNQSGKIVVREWKNT